jgi:CheY-like chemotaxis protein
MKRIKILVVEDEFVTATDIQMALAGMGYDVPAVVDNGEEAIRKAGELRPSLVLMDIGLAGRMTGIEAGKQIRERFDIPVIYLTAHSDESTFWSALASEPYGYILKPFKTSEMKYNIEMALHKHGKAPADGERGANGFPKAVSRKLPLLVLLAVALVIAFLVHPFGFLQSGGTGPAPPSTGPTPVPTAAATPTMEAQDTNTTGIVMEIAREYHDTHTYLGVETGQSSDIYVCLDMAKDVWNMIKTRGINAVLEVGNIDRNITTVQDVNHAWVLAEVAPMEWLAVETTGGFIVTKDENPRYYSGMQFDTPADMRDYSCGKGYCFSNTCVDNECQECGRGLTIGTDLQCHPECGSSYCTGNSMCVDGRCLRCDPGYVIGTDNRCHPTCIDANHYCLEGFVCGADNRCHPA